MFKINNMKNNKDFWLESIRGINLVNPLRDIEIKRIDSYQVEISKKFNKDWWWLFFKYFGITIIILLVWSTLFYFSIKAGEETLILTFLSSCYLAFNFFRLILFFIKHLKEEFWIKEYKTKYKEL